MRWTEDFLNKLICGDCLEVMKTMPDNCIDTIITDPPYGLEFMGNSWDSFSNNTNSALGGQSPANKGNKIFPKRGKPIIGWCKKDRKAKYNYQEWIKKWAKEALRVAKPGSTLLCFGGTRTYHRLACAIEDAGWIIKDCVMYLYGQGFPKATDISKQIDKNCNKTSKELIKFGKLIRKYRNKKAISQKELGIKIGVSRELINLYEIRGNNQQQFPTKEKWLKIKQELKIEKDKDYIFIEAEREVIGKQKNIANKNNENTGRYQWNTEKQKRVDSINITAPATPEATLWNGWKSHGLKPAYEPILVAMKPNEGSYANNALKWGVAGINVDGGRINYINQEPNLRTNKGNWKDSAVCNKAIWHGDGRGERTEPHSKGRYPSNVILDEEAGRLLDEQSGVSKSIAGPANNEPTNADSKIYGWAKYPKMHKSGAHFGDTGGASRFFYCAKASKAERNRGCEGLPKKYYEKRKDPIKMIWCKKCNHYIDPNRKVKGNCCCEVPDPFYREIKFMPSANTHPTVKPLALMKYLCILTKTPTGGIVLDPFCGSGTTLMACKELKRDYIGIDNNPEYCEIARRRVNATMEPLF